MSGPMVPLHKGEGSKPFAPSFLKPSTTLGNSPEASLLLQINLSCSVLCYHHRGSIATTTMFGVVFPDRSFPMDASSFTQIDPFHWVLDINTFVGEAYQDVKQVCVFLLTAASLPPGKALAVYAQAHGAPYAFCGAVHVARPSALLRLPWPDPDNAAAQGPHNARIGVAVEDLAALPLVADAGALAGAERLALRVGESLFNFMQSFCGVDGGRLVVPADVLDRWFNKFRERAKRDPDYLNSFTIS